MPLRPPAGFIRPGFDPLKNPDAPTIGTATGGDTSASVSFTPPANVGGSAISAYYAVSNPGGITASGASSPVSVTGLTNGTAYTFAVWALNTYGPGPFSSASGSVIPDVQVFGLFAGGNDGAGDDQLNTIDYINIGTTGNATDFGDLTQGRRLPSACSSATRGVFAGGLAGTATNTMDYVTIASAGNAADFGDMSQALFGRGGLASSTRGVFGGGGSGDISRIDYITIASTGNTTFFGNLTQYGSTLGALSSPTRGVWGGRFKDGARNNTIDYVTIASTGNATDFGDLTVVRSNLGGCSSETRGLFVGGLDNSTVIDYITIASTGNATDFGDALDSPYSLGACSSSTRAVFGTNSGIPNNVLNYVTISTTGNSADFGDLTQSRGEICACSNGHGGL